MGKFPRGPQRQCACLFCWRIRVRFRVEILRFVLCKWWDVTASQLDPTSLMPLFVPGRGRLLLQELPFGLLQFPYCKQFIMDSTVSLILLWGLLPISPLGDPAYLSSGGSCPYLRWGLLPISPLGAPALSRLYLFIHFAIISYIFNAFIFSNKN